MSLLYLETEVFVITDVSVEFEDIGDTVMDSKFWHIFTSNSEWGTKQQFVVKRLRVVKQTREHYTSERGFPCLLACGNYKRKCNPKDVKRKPQTHTEITHEL